MGILETIGRLMMKLVPGGGALQAQMTEEWEDNLSPEDMVELAKQGYDIEGIKARVAERKEKREREQREFIEKSTQLLNFDKLNDYLATPRDPESDFIQDTIKMNTTPLLGKSDWVKNLCNSPVLYGAIVQAHGSLYKPDASNNMLGTVVVISPDPEYARKTDWLKGVAAKIGKLKESSQVPADCKELIHKLRDSQSIFCFKVGESVTGGPEAWCVTYTISKQKYLPQACMPINRILPFLLSRELKHQITASLELIPAKYYSNEGITL
ncbi:MAG: hypothetical protein LUG98_09210 [Tannerellaceae bacterium]|nr:hypothetical protein [Tannerellaceae bacterium]